MRVDRPHPGEELNEGEVTEPRQAASIIVLRDSPDGPEVLLVQRNPKQRFMGGAWVFPGGAVHGEDAAWSRWITPEEVKVRFDTWFFVAEAPPGAEATVDGAECVDSRWLRPAAALDAFARDELMLVFPTIKHLEALGQADSVADALHKARTREVVPVQPRLLVREGKAEIVLPGEKGYDEAKPA